MTNAAFLLQAFVPQVWIRGAASVVRGALELDLSTAERYEIRGGPQLTLDLLRVNTPAEAIGFIQRHGMLTVSPTTRVARETWEMWESTLLALRLFVGHTVALEPLATRIGHLNTLREVWPLLGLEEPVADDEFELLGQTARCVGPGEPPALGNGARAPAKRRRSAAHIRRQDSGPSNARVRRGRDLSDLSAPR